MTDEETKTLTTNNIILQVFTYMLENNCNKRKACKDLGIAYSTFNRKLAENPKIHLDFLAKQQEVFSLNLAKITLGKQELLKNLLRDAADPKLKTMEKIALMGKLSELEQTYQRGLGVETDQEKGAKEWLRGAQLQPGQAKIIKTETTMELVMPVEQIPSEIIDAEVKSEKSS